MDQEFDWKVFPGMGYHLSDSQNALIFRVRTVGCGDRSCAILELITPIGIAELARLDTYADAEGKEKKCKEYAEFLLSEMSV